jgi:hypothetical protein
MRYYSNCWRNEKYKKKDWHGLDTWSQWNETIMKSSTRVLRKKIKWTERTPYELHKKKIIIHWYPNKSELYYDMASSTLCPPIQSPLYLSFGLTSGLFDNNSESYCMHVQITVLSILLNVSHRASTFSSCLCPGLLLRNTPQILHLKCL